MALFRPHLILFSCFLLISSLIFTSCQKEEMMPENVVPVGHTLPSQTITLPVDSVTLTGAGTDTDGTVVAYLWSQFSGPAASTIVNPAAASTKVKGLHQGTYVFQLMVTDNKGASGFATTTVIVNPAPIQTLTLQPSNNPSEISITELNGQNQSGTNSEISIDAWTISGQPWFLRSLIKFDLSSIPANATILSANLYLYSTPTPITGDQVNANSGTSNGLFLQQITSNWNPSTVGWFTQPTASASNQISLATTSQSFLDLTLDVTSMVGSMVNSNANYGFLLKLQNEAVYNSRIFVSSYNTTYPAKHPKLVIVYQ